MLKNETTPAITTQNLWHFKWVRKSNNAFFIILPIFSLFSLKKIFNYVG